jgi:hypothetical protein
LKLAVRLTEEVLALHPGILKAFVLEQRDGKVAVAEEAAKPGSESLAFEIEESLRSGALIPVMILGAATEFNKSSDILRLVGVLYGNGGVILTHLSEDRLLAICTEALRFHEALQSVNGALPSLIRELGGLRPVDYVKSAAEAEDIARGYVCRAGNVSQVSFDEVALNHTRRMWEIQGHYRSSALGRSRRFSLQLDAESGAVMGFASRSGPSLMPLLLGICLAVGALVFLVWLITDLLSRG